MAMTATETQALADYFKKVQAIYLAGNATEHSYRPALQALLEALNASNITATNEPKRIACGAPDYVHHPREPHPARARLAGSRRRMSASRWMRRSAPTSSRTATCPTSITSS